MENIETYIAKTESAVRKLFEGIESYQMLLEPIPLMPYSKPQPGRAKQLDEYNAWREQNELAVKASKEARRKFSEESFAISVLCGAVLQVAEKAIECCSKNEHVPESARPLVEQERHGISKVCKNIKRFCIGREVYGIPIGLIIYAGRNQHIHFNARPLMDINVNVFERLALRYEEEAGAGSAFDLNNPHLVSCASNVTHILGWRSGDARDAYDAYAADLKELLES